MAESSTSGGDFLDKKSGLTKSLKRMPKLTNVLVVDDCSTDIKRLRARLHLIFGYEIDVRDANTLSSAIDQVLKQKPQLILLDDHLSVTVSDNGPGIPLGRQEAVFHPFRSYRREPNGGCQPNAELAHGMGLAFVKRTVETVGGQLHLISNPAERRGSEFRLSWPLAPSHEATGDR